MKYRIEFEGDWFEETNFLKTLVKAQDISIALHEAQLAIRQRLKYGENISEEEEKILRILQDILYVDVDCE